MRVLFIVALAGASVLRAQAPLDRILARLAEEADVFGSMARDMISQETLTHKWAKAPKRFRAAGADAKPAFEYETRTVVSEYGFGSFTDAPSRLHEFRKVVSINGRPLVDSGKARQTLGLNLKSPNDKAKRDMLREFAKAGLTTGVTDFGQLLLLFTKRSQSRFAFTAGGVKFVGADACSVVRYAEKSDQMLTVFEGKLTTHQAMAGEILVRTRDLLPVRVTMAVTRAAPKPNDPEVAIEVAVDYRQTPHGTLMPSTISHRETARETLISENVFAYAPFKRFGAGSEIKFDFAEPK